ncbi:hypothetical protein F2P81_024486 [Scophthalmus maximus]|uniref:Secreted protein n=1 Tax=Scophthalmus maximus TaxID=52904 RepID=A0A6A4RMW0_SCOMX|nr:hypothetical protein F2P81_024486 [Scophthalmus maximus]
MMSASFLLSSSLLPDMVDCASDPDAPSDPAPAALSDTNFPRRLVHTRRKKTETPPRTPDVQWNLTGVKLIGVTASGVTRRLFAATCVSLCKFPPKALNESNER